MLVLDDGDRVVGAFVRFGAAQQDLRASGNVAANLAKIGIDLRRVNTAGLDVGEILIPFVGIENPEAARIQYDDLAAAIARNYPDAIVEPDVEEETTDPPQDDDQPPEATTKYPELWGNKQSPKAESDPKWHLVRSKITQAWALPPKPGVAGSNLTGRGVFVAHPDTGYTDHPELDGTSISKEIEYDFCGFDNNDAHDELTLDFNLGHGTSSSSVLISGHANHPPAMLGKEITGVAPDSSYAPLRCVRIVGRISYRNVARAVKHASAHRCDVLFMCLGGIKAAWGAKLEEAISEATAGGMIVIAAAGNPPAKKVVFPARLDTVICAAASDYDDQPCDWSCRGPEVDITVPGDTIWRARVKGRFGTPRYDTYPSKGTTYASTTLAGAASMWISYHGREAIYQVAGKAGVSTLFRTLVKQTARVPSSGWDHKNFGAGLLNVRDLLLAPLA